VVITFLPRTAPAMPSSRIRRSTVHRVTGCPRRFNSCQTFLAAHTEGGLADFGDELLESGAPQEPGHVADLAFPGRVAGGGSETAAVLDEHVTDRPDTAEAAPVLKTP
jgi:hypothetical protein